MASGSRDNSRSVEVIERLFANEPVMQLWDEGFEAEFPEPLDELALALVFDEVNSPEALASLLVANAPYGARRYSDAIWTAVCNVVPKWWKVVDWSEVYERTEEDSGDQEEEVMPLDNSASITAWAATVKDCLEHVASLAEAVAGQKHLFSDHKDAARQISEDILAPLRGEIPPVSWNLNLQESPEEITGTRRTFEISLERGSIRCGIQEPEGKAQGARYFELSPGEGPRGRELLLNHFDEIRHLISQKTTRISIEHCGDTISGYGRNLMPAATDSEADRLTKALLAKLVEDIQNIPTDAGMLSGEGSGLVNLWDEICVQAQISESAHWESYESIMRVAANSIPEDLTFAQRSILWLATPAGEEWSDENDQPESPAIPPKPANEEIADYLYEKLLELAGSYRNHRTIAYANRF